MHDMNVHDCACVLPLDTPRPLLLLSVFVSGGQGHILEMRCLKPILLPWSGLKDAKRISGDWPHIR